MKNLSAPTISAMKGSKRSSGSAETQMLREVLAGRTFHLRGVPHVGVTIIDAVHPLHHPATGRFDGRHSQAGEALKHATVHYRRQRHAGVLDVIHALPHEAGIRLLMPLVPD